MEGAMTIDNATPAQRNVYMRLLQRDTEEMYQRLAYETFPYRKAIEYEALGYLDPRFRPQLPGKTETQCHAKTHHSR